MINLENSMTVVRSLGYQQYQIILAVNHCGGIWDMWNNQDYQLTVTMVSSRIIIFKVVDLSSRFEFYCVGIYAPAQNHDKDAFWL